MMETKMIPFQSLLKARSSRAFDSSKYRYLICRQYKFLLLLLFFRVSGKVRSSQLKDTIIAFGGQFIHKAAVSLSLLGGERMSRPFKDDHLAAEFLLKVVRS